MFRRFSRCPLHLYFFRRSFRQSFYSRLLRTTFIVVFASIVIDTLSLYFRIVPYQSPHGLNSISKVHGVRVYIAAIHWNNERILRSHWNDALLQIVDDLGHDNVFVSIQESGSWDNSKDALRSLDHRLSNLNVSHSIVLEDRTHADEIADGPLSSGWIQTPRGMLELRRIPYLARLRNSVMEPLKEFSKQGIVFDKILFLNDVVFKVRNCTVPLLGPS